MTLLGSPNTQSKYYIKKYMKYLYKIIYVYAKHVWGDFIPYKVHLITPLSTVKVEKRS